MAGRKSKKKAVRPDAFAISGIHMLALDVERMATVAYVTRPDQLGAVLNALRTCIETEHAIARGPQKLADVECRSPYIPCDGLCVMDCPGENPPPPESLMSRGKKDKGKGKGKKNKAK